jgi:hypothetical protein
LSRQDGRVSWCRAAVCSGHQLSPDLGCVGFARLQCLFQLCTRVFGLMTFNNVKS